MHACIHEQSQFVGSEDSITAQPAAGLPLPVNAAEDLSGSGAPTAYNQSVFGMHSKYAIIINGSNRKTTSILNVHW
jgi:hypothetical protein